MTEEFFLDNDRTREFIGTVERIAEDHEEVPALLNELKGPFRELLLDDEWLPERYRSLPDGDYDDKGRMGEDIAQWLLYRKEGELVLFSLVVPPGHETPVHDHLSWGLVGLYQGTQWEEFYRRTDDANNDEGYAKLELERTQEQSRGDLYTLIPPEGDVHSVKTTSETPSVSIHLLGADVGCIPRHAFDPEADFVEQFRSGYTNVECDFEADEPAHGHTHSH